MAKIDASDTTILENPAPLIPAATVVPVRDGADGPEVLLVRRVGRGAFAGFSVFPGGRVDPEDVDPSAPDDELAAARRAAVREAEEEVGLVVDAATMAVLSHWTPPPFEMKRFGTWFFVAAADGEVRISEGELSEFEWVRPADALMAAEAGKHTLAPPTWVSLHALSNADSVDELLAMLRARSPERFFTWPVRRDPMVLTWAPDPCHLKPLAEVDLDAPGPRHRLFIENGKSRYVRSGF